MRTEESFGLMKSAKDIGVAIDADGDRVGGLLNEQDPLPVGDGDPAFDYGRHLRSLRAQLDAAKEKVAVTEDEHAARLIRVARQYSERKEVATGRYDEVAVWHRALTAEEIDGLFLRGARQVHLRVRACDDEACEGEEFLGPIGDPARTYIDTFLHPQDVEHGLPELIGRYVQYQMVFSRMQGVVSPKIAAVEIAGEPLD